MIRITYRGGDASITVGRDSPSYVYGGRDLPEDIQGFPAFILDTKGLGVDESGSVYRDGSVNYTFGGGTDGRDITTRPVSPIGELAYTPATIKVSDEELENPDGSKTKTRSTEFDLPGTMRRMTGETALEIELGTESLGNLVPGTDFTIGEKVLLSIWGRDIEVIVSGYSYTPTGWTATVQTEDQLRDFEAQKRRLSSTTFWEEIEDVREELRGIQDDSAYGEESAGGVGSGVIRVEKGSDGKLTVVYSEGPDDVYEADISDIDLDGDELVLKKGEEEFKRIPLPSGSGGGGGGVTEEQLLYGIQGITLNSHATAHGNFANGRQDNGESTPTVPGVNTEKFSIPIRGYSAFPSFRTQMIKAAPYSCVAFIRASKNETALSSEGQLDPDNFAFFMIKMKKVIVSSSDAYYTPLSGFYGENIYPLAWVSTNAKARLTRWDDGSLLNDFKEMKIVDNATGETWTGYLDITLIPTSIFPDSQEYNTQRDFLSDVYPSLFPPY